MEKNTNDLIIDWELSTKLAGNKRHIAEELLNLLIKNLPGELAEMKKAYKNNDTEKLLLAIHKLRGALCYCGVPRLRNAILTLEMALRRNKESEIETLFAQFEFEVDELLLFAQN